MIITISGPPGCGKTTVANLLAEEHHLHLITTGLMFRAMAKEKGMTLDQFGELAARDPSIDRQLDDRWLQEARKWAAQGRGVLVEGRLAAHVVHRRGLPAFKVFLDAPPGVRLKRIQLSEREGERFDAEGLRRRERLEVERYRLIYGIDVADLSVYDLVLDTTDLTPEEVAGRITKGAGL